LAERWRASLRAVQAQTNDQISNKYRRYLRQIQDKKLLARQLTSDEAINLKAKSSVALTRSGGRQIQQLARHE
jgi:hypothetical protein